MPNMDDLYRIVRIPKRRGGYRQLEIPISYLADIQREILEELHRFIQFPLWVYGVPHRGPVHNALAHVRFHRGGRFILFKFDIKDFFPSTTRDRVLQALQEHGVPPSLIEKVSRYCFFQDRLPQGAPTSPTLANLAAIALDRDLVRYIIGMFNRSVWQSRKYALLYTRYFDDLTLSFSPDSDPPPRTRITAAVEAIASRYGYVLNGKTRILSEDQVKVITGVVITPSGNLRPTKRVRRKIRALLHRLQHLQDGKEKEELIQSLQGLLSWARSINPKDPLALRVQRLLQPA